MSTVPSNPTCFIARIHGSLKLFFQFLLQTNEICLATLACVWEMNHHHNRCYIDGLHKLLVKQRSSDTIIMLHVGAISLYQYFTIHHWLQENIASLSKLSMDSGLRCRVRSQKSSPKRGEQGRRMGWGEGHEVNSWRYIYISFV